MLCKSADVGMVTGTAEGAIGDSQNASSQLKVPHTHPRKQEAFILRKLPSPTEKGGKGAV